MQTILPEELKKRLDAGEKPILLDVREPWEFSICKIEGSVNISMSEPEKLINELTAVINEKKVLQKLYFIICNLNLGNKVFCIAFVGEYLTCNHFLH